MRLEVSTTGLSFKNLLKLIFVGYLIGALIIAIPFFAFDLFHSEDSIKSSLYIFLIVPMFAIQAILTGLVVSFGLFVYSKFYKLEFSFTEQTSNPAFKRDAEKRGAP